MKLENFDEWFAIRPNHADTGRHIEGRLKFNVDSGVSLDAISFGLGVNDWNTVITGGTMTGWIDYQRPATLVEPWTQSFSGLNLGVNTPTVRDRRRYVASAILKNVFLTDINEAIFEGIIFQHPALHAWINPRLIEQEDVTQAAEEKRWLNIGVSRKIERNFSLADGTKVSLVSSNRVSGQQDVSIDTQTQLTLSFAKPVSFVEIPKFIWRLSTIFEFLVAKRFEAPGYKIITTQTREWNSEHEKITAEYIYCPTKRKKICYDLPPISERMTTENTSSVPIESILSYAIGLNDELIYLANAVQSARDFDLDLATGFTTIVACLEDFDRREHGSGRSLEFNNDIANLKKVVSKYGTKRTKSFFRQVKGKIPNSYSLTQRLERLHESWKQDGFRGEPNLKHIRDIRNMIAHGRGFELSSSIFSDMVFQVDHLTALGRYHVMRKLGFSAEDIKLSFKRNFQNYGRYVLEMNLSNI